MIGFIHYPKSKRHLNIEQINYLNQFVAKAHSSSYSCCESYI